MPPTQMMLRLAAGSPNVESKPARSLAMSGFPNASMMTMVSPRPVRLLGMLYARRTWAGPRQPGFEPGAWHENTPAFGFAVSLYNGLPLYVAGTYRPVAATATVPAVTPASGMAARDAIALTLRNRHVSGPGAGSLYADPCERTTEEA